MSSFDEISGVGRSEELEPLAVLSIGTARLRESACSCCRVSFTVVPSSVTFSRRVGCDGELECLTCSFWLLTSTMSSIEVSSSALVWYLAELGGFFGSEAGVRSDGISFDGLGDNPAPAFAGEFAWLRLLDWSMV